MGARIVFTTIALIGALGVGRIADARELDLSAWLGRPGVRLVAVEFYATWCEPCMAAVPKWKALYDKYHDRGLRLIVVATRDPRAGCKTVGWTPDDQICDLDGFVADSFGTADELPSAFLFSWQGNSLASRAPVEDVERAIEAYMQAEPRVSITASRNGQHDAALAALVQVEVQRTGKLVVVPGLPAGGSGKSAAARCRVGSALTANSSLDVTVSGDGPTQVIALELRSIESGCQNAIATARWQSNQPTQSVAEVVAALLTEIATRPKLTPKAPAAVAPVPPAVPVPVATPSPLPPAPAPPAPVVAPPPEPVALPVPVAPAPPVVDAAPVLVEPPAAPAVTKVEPPPIVDTIPEAPVPEPPPTELAAQVPDETIVLADVGATETGISTLQIAGWSTLGAGIALGLSGGAVWGVTNSDDVGYDGEVTQGEQDDLDTGYNAAFALVGLGGGAIAAGIALLFWPDDEEPGMTWWVAPGGADRVHVGVQF